MPGIIGIAALVLLASACGGGADAESPPVIATTTTAPIATPTSTQVESATTDTAETTTTMSELEASPTADETVLAFYEAWSQGNIEDAMALVSPDMRSSFGTHEAMRNFMKYVHEVGRKHTVSDCLVAANGTTDIVTCTVQAEGDVVEALGAGPPRERHLVGESLLLNATFSPTYASADRALASVASTVDARGYEEACAGPGDGSAAQFHEVVYTGDCGAFIGGFAEAATAVVSGFQPGADADPVAVVLAFYGSWNAGNVAEASAFLSPDVISEVATEAGPGFHRLRNFMEFVASIPQSVSATECKLLGSSTNPAIVNCLVEYHDPLIDAMAIGGARVPHKVGNGLLLSVNVGGQYVVSERALSEFASQADPEAMQTACKDPDAGYGLVYAEFGLAYDGRCGAFVGQFIDEAAAAFSDN
jgi:ketosteroid isomerase-like protein